MRPQIADYALIGDLRTAALVSSDGSIDWLCLPRFDSPAVCAALLGDADHGHWTLAPVRGGRCTRRRYRSDTLILETDWVTAEGAVRVTDFMPPTAEYSQVIRIVEGLAGTVRMRSRLSLRMEYGKSIPTMEITADGGVRIGGEGVSLSLRSDALVRVEADSCGAEFVAAAGDRICFTLDNLPTSTSTPSHHPPGAWRAATEQFWKVWISRCTYTGTWAEEVKRSLIVLKALTYAPSGGVLAAATTSLPEHVGGSRNWDYRFCWLRDASFTMEAFLATGFTQEAAAWRDWLLSVVADNSEEISIMYGIDGRRCTPETTLDWLPGHADSTPVRIGNQAAAQHQHDVWGEVLAALHAAHAAGVPRTDAEDALEDALVDRLRGSWNQPDHGLWEVRGPCRHFVHSKLMSWVGLDHVIRHSERVTSSGSRQSLELRELRQVIHADICSRGFNTARGAFTQAYGSARLDAAVLLMPRYGFLPWTDARVISSVDAIQRDLTRNGLVLRYAVSDHGPNIDGVPGEEGAFLACSFWLVDALHGIGRTPEAVELFERLVSLSNDVGLLSEECEPVSGRHLGNTPQAFSHAGLVMTAVRLGGGAAGVAASSSSVLEGAAG